MIIPVDNRMKPVIIQHIIKQLKKVKPSKIVVDTNKDHSKYATIFILVLTLIILMVVFK